LEETPSKTAFNVSRGGMAAEKIWGANHLTNTTFIGTEKAV